MSDDHFERRLTRTAAIRLAAAGAAGLALGARPARAAESAGQARRESRTRLPRVVVTRAPRSGDLSVRRRRAHALALDRACVGTAERPPVRSGLDRAAQARTDPAPLEQLAGRLPKGTRHHGAAGRAPAHGHGARRPVRPRSLLRLGIRHSRRPSVGLAARRAPSLQELHRRRGRPRRRAVLPRRVADPRRERVPLGRGGVPDDAARGGCRTRDRPLAQWSATPASRVLVGVTHRPPHPERGPA